MNFNDIVSRFGTDFFPNLIQLVFVLMALVGLIIVYRTILDLYKITLDGTTELGKTGTSTVISFLIAGLMMVPSVVLWRSAELFLGSGSVTNNSLTAYTNGAPITTTCDNMGRLLILFFMAAGIIAIFNGLRRWHDAATGFEREGYRTGTGYIIGGILCFFIGDVVEIIGNTIGLDIGIENVCAQLG